MKVLFTILCVCFLTINCESSNNQMTNSETMKTQSLFEPIKNNDISMVKSLIEKGVNIDQVNNKGETPLLKATQLNRVEIAQLLLEAGADVNKQDNIKDSPFLYACAEGRIEILKLMLNYKPNVRIYNRYGGNGIIPAAEKGHLENVRLLLEKTDMDVNHVNNLGWTALLEAIILTNGGKVYQDIVKVLVQHGADVNLADRQGVKPLTHAKKRGYKEIEKILLQAGAQG